MITPSDPRNFYAAERTLLAAERTLLAWNRTSLALMGFGFLIERFGLYAFAQLAGHSVALERVSSFVLGIFFIVLGIGVAVLSVFQYKSIIDPITRDIPKGYSVRTGVITNWFLALFGIFLILVLLISFFITG